LATDDSHPAISTALEQAIREAVIRIRINGRDLLTEIEALVRQASSEAHADGRRAGILLMRPWFDTAIGRKGTLTFAEWDALVEQYLSAAESPRPTPPETER
jgi:hypothetical protein